jgi:hypothetical protein
VGAAYAAFTIVGGFLAAWSGVMGLLLLIHLAIAKEASEADS